MFYFLPAFTSFLVLPIPNKFLRLHVRHVSAENPSLKNNIAMEEVRWRQQKQKKPMNPTPIPAQTSSSLIPNPFLPSFSSPYRHHATSTAQSYAATCSKIFQSLDHFDPLCIQEMLKKRKKRVCGRWNDAPRWSLSSIPPRKGERPRREARMALQTRACESIALSEALYKWPREVWEKQDDSGCLGRSLAWEDFCRSEKHEVRGPNQTAIAQITERFGEPFVRKTSENYPYWSE